MFLGEGNRFTLGSIHPIDGYELGMHVRHLLQLCYWFVGVFLWFYRESVPQISNGDFVREFLNLTPRRLAIRKVLDEQLQRMQDETQNEPVPKGIGPTYAKDEKGKRQS